MNRLSIEKRTQIVSLLVEGNSLRSVTRITGCSINTVTKLLVDVGIAAADYHNQHVRRVKTLRLQCDEIWSFVGAKKKNATADQKKAGWGDAWTWVGLDADSKLCVSYYVGMRDKGSAHEFMQDCASRILGRPQITTDSLKAYPEAVEAAFGMDVDYAQLHKIYGAPEETEARYSPATCIGADMKVCNGDPDPRHVSTSHVERQNLTMRMGMRRFTRLTNGFSKKLGNHFYAVALHFLYYNFGRIHKTLRVTPAMEAGIADHVWSMEEIAALPGKMAYAA